MGIHLLPRWKDPAGRQISWALCSELSSISLSSLCWIILRWASSQQKWLQQLWDSCRHTEPSRTGRHGSVSAPPRVQRFTLIGWVQVTHDAHSQPGLGWKALTVSSSPSPNQGLWRQIPETTQMPNRDPSLWERGTDAGEATSNTYYKSHGSLRS